MRDAFGGVVNLVMIVVFLVIVSGYLAFNVNYTKAFRVKNYIISTFEEYEGKCDVSSSCNTKIKEYMKAIGYSAVNFSIQDYTCHDGYCYKKTQVSAAGEDLKERAYFKVVTQINIDIPIINKILPSLKIFQVSGDTKQITIR